MPPRVLAWSQAVLRWAAEPSLAWKTIGVLMVALLVSLWPGASEVQIRLTGLVLQWLGIATVAYGVRETRKLFGRPSLVVLLHQWVSRFPRWRPRVITAVMSDGVGVSSALARGYGWSKVNPASTLQDQIQALTKNVEHLNDRLVQTENETRSGLSQHSEALREEEQARSTGDEHLRSRLEAAETGGLHITFAGVIWLFLGVLLSTLSPEIARWRS